MKLGKVFRQVILAIACHLAFVPWGAAENPRGKFVIAIDIGHTRNRGGAISSRGISEYSFNRDVGLLLFSELVKAGFTKAFIINEKGNDISLIARAIQANTQKANLFISVHHDSVQPFCLSEWSYGGKDLSYCDFFKGFSIFISEENGNPRASLLLAKLLGTELLNRKFKPTLHHADPVIGENRKLLDKEKGIYEFNQLIVLKNTVAPAVLLECGIIKNREEEESINYDYRRKLVSAVVSAVTHYFEKLK